MEELLKEADNLLEMFCDGFSDMPCGCEGCPMFTGEEEEGCDLATFRKQLKEKEVKGA